MTKFMSYDKLYAILFKFVTKSKNICIVYNAAHECSKYTGPRTLKKEKSADLSVIENFSIDFCLAIITICYTYFTWL